MRELCRIIQHLGSGIVGKVASRRYRTKNSESCRIGRLSPIISAKPVGVGAASQRLIPTGETIWIADAHRGQRFIVRADETLAAFRELKAAIRAGDPLNRSHLS